MWLSFFIKYSIIAAGILVLIRWILKKMVWGTIDKTNEITAKGKIVLITGSNSGVGRATALEFALRDANVVLACRNLDKAIDTVNWIRMQTSLGQLICMKLDLASLQSVRKFAQDFKAKYDRLDILINNAGVMMPPEQKNRTNEGFEIHMGVNHLGHFLLTNLLLEPLKKAAPSRVINVSSMAHSWCTLDLNDIMSDKQDIKPKPEFLPNDLYSRSKLANALFNKELAKRLEGTGVRTYALCPGVVSTDLGQNLKSLTILLMKPIEPIVRYMLKTPQEGAETTMYCALSKNLMSESGEMYQNCGYWDPKNRATLKDEDAKKLWEQSAKLVGL